MATQERNVYAGLAVVIGGLMHARPKFFAKVMGELLFWVGEDKMLFGSDYAIWEPKWQVEGFVDWEMPDDSEYADYPRLGVEGKKKILGLNGAKLYGVEVPEELRAPVPADEPASQEDAQRRRCRGEPALPRPRSARHGLRPGARRADHHARLRRLLRRDRRTATSRCGCASPRRSARRTSRSSWRPTPAPPCAGCRRCATWRSCSRTTTREPRSTPRWAAATGSPAPSRARRRASWTRSASCSSARRWSRARGACWRTVDDPATATLGELSGPDAERCRALRRALGMDASDHAPAFVKGDGIAVSADEVARFKRLAGLTALSLETNGGMCRDLLRVRYEEEGVAA